MPWYASDYYSHNDDNDDTVTIHDTDLSFIYQDDQSKLDYHNDSGDNTAKNNSDFIPEV